MTTSPIPFIFVGNLACIDFVNTEPIIQGERVDLLGSFDELVNWLEASEAIMKGSARRAKRWSGASEGEAVFRQAILLREILRDAVERLSAGKLVSPETVKVVNRILASRPVYRQLLQEGRGYITRLEPVSEVPLHLLVPVAESAAWLLEHGDRSLVRQCENPECVLFFYDTTKNKTRRWCSMDGCGSRAKAMAYYRRKKEGR